MHKHPTNTGVFYVRRDIRTRKALKEAVATAPMSIEPQGLSRLEPGLQRGVVYMPRYPEPHKVYVPCLIDGDKAVIVKVLSA